MTRTNAKRSSFRSLAHLDPDEVKSVADGYTAIYDAGERDRKEQYRSFVRQFYNLVTDSTSSAGASPSTSRPDAVARA